MTNQSEGVRAEVTFKTARRAMAHARKKSIPTGPSTIEEVIGGFEAGTYPPLYQGMYVGSVHNDTTGKFIKFSLMSIINQDLLSMYIRVIKQDK